MGAKFPNIDADNLTAVVLNTPNPLYSTELLCGIYEEPSFEGHLKKMKHELERSFVKYNPALDENSTVEYSYESNSGKQLTNTCSLQDWLSWESI